jgi:hypothetical protein
MIRHKETKQSPLPHGKTPNNPIDLDNSCPTDMHAYMAKDPSSFHSIRLRHIAAGFRNHGWQNIGLISLEAGDIPSKFIEVIEPGNFCWV